MSTKMNEADWEVALEVFRACLPARGAKGNQISALTADQSYRPSRAVYNSKIEQRPRVCLNGLPAGKKKWARFGGQRTIRKAILAGLPHCFDPAYETFVVLIK